jgi:hypothetical protein
MVRSAVGRCRTPLSAPTIALKSRAVRADEIVIRMRVPGPTVELDGCAATVRPVAMSVKGTNIAATLKRAAAREESPMPVFTSVAASLNRYEHHKGADRPASAFDTEDDFIE